eukprot:CAMPEP_0183765588 /NCGR_PEP_ID=MMETSP0739-20130205/11046_1 /TAXON_ID=385413 /ORGANISM="Thalassiosira miniscula, Strain CCMP1093" /LENGTH=618 /DNA_ID=CAMNT_0026004285 /DNA_START=133 /DNA_END=1989 /DNA_ORIENTATION=-
MATSKIDSVVIDIDPDHPDAVPGANHKNDATNSNNPYQGNPGGKPSASQHRAMKSQRMAERRARVKAAIANLPHEPNSKLQRMSEEELKRAMEASDLVAKEKRELRMGWEKEVKRREGRLNGGRGGDKDGKYDIDVEDDLGRRLWGNSGNGDPYEPMGGLVEEADYYDKWQQAYRFLGGFIDCSHSWGEGSHDSGGNENRGDGDGACSRWMMWAAYIDPNYAGGGYSEYFGDGAPGSLDCHSPDTQWKLIGVYRQEFYQYIEQISKHLWAIDEYEYIVALAGLEYMTDDECFGVGYDEKGNNLYANVQPLQGGAFQMGLYSDAKCIQLNTQTSYTYDDFAETTELDLGSKDQTDDDAFHQQAYQYWLDTQEYTLTNLNTVYNDFKFCTSCVDYPTYQDGYFIGDDGTDDDDLINQCWKFYSHDSFNCDADCIAMGAEQGSITWISYGGKQFGQLIEGQYAADHDKTTLGEGGMVTSSSSNGSHKIERLKANLFLTFAGIVFVATFLAFAVARGSSKKKKSSRSRSRRLLDADYEGSGRRSSRSASRSRRLASSEKSRSSRSKSKSRSGKSVKSKSSSRSKSRSRRSEYEPPSSSSEKKSRSSRSQSRSRKSSSRRSDD